MKRFTLSIEATVEAEDVIDALVKVARHFQARADSLQYGTHAALPVTFERGWRVELVAARTKEDGEGDDTLTGDSPAA